HAFSSTPPHKSSRIRHQNAHTHSHTPHFLFQLLSELSGILR
ncbi:hypothetical protein LINPERPRIM_LOCUS241, partial [Linum perenne]